MRRQPKQAFNLNVFFLFDTPRGTEKTFLTKRIQRFLQPKEKRFLAVISSAVAAQLLDGDCTAHSALKILIPVIS